MSAGDCWRAALLTAAMAGVRRGRDRLMGLQTDVSDRVATRRPLARGGTGAYPDGVRPQLAALRRERLDEVRRELAPFYNEIGRPS